MKFNNKISNSVLFSNDRGFSSMLISNIKEISFRLVTYLWSYLHILMTVGIFSSYTCLLAGIERKEKEKKTTEYIFIIIGYHVHVKDHIFIVKCNRKSFKI